MGVGSDAWEGAVDEDENGSEGADVLLDLIHNTLIVELILLNAARVDQPRRVKDANLGWVSRVLTAFKNIGTYYYTVVALKFVEVSRGSRVEGIDVAVIDVLTGKDISEEFQE